MRQPARRVILGSHLVWTGYGHWLSNDPRGSWSVETRKSELRELGDEHFGRNPDQPSRTELRAFYRDAEERLEHPVVWFDEPIRKRIACVIEEVVKARGYTVWAFAVCRNHMHGLFRAHRDHAQVMWALVAQATRDRLQGEKLVPDSHPVWSHRPSFVFKHDHQQVMTCVDYIAKNPTKEGLPRQHWPFVSSVPF